MIKEIMTRDYKIDNIKAIAMMLIILAHCEFPLQVNNARSFDVITLVFMSTLVVRKISRKIMTMNIRVYF